MEGGGTAYGAGKAGGPFDPFAYIRKPQVILRAVSWVSSPDVSVIFIKTWSRSEGEMRERRVDSWCCQIPILRELVCVQGAGSDSTLQIFLSHIYISYLHTQSKVVKVHKSFLEIIDWPVVSLGRIHMKYAWL